MVKWLFLVALMGCESEACDQQLSRQVSKNAKLLQERPAEFARLWRERHSLKESRVELARWRDKEDASSIELTRQGADYRVVVVSDSPRYRDLEKLEKISLQDFEQHHKKSSLVEIFRRTVYLGGADSLDVYSAGDDVNKLYFRSARQSFDCEYQEGAYACNCRAK